jgi:hypothetical protein
MSDASRGDGNDVMTAEATEPQETYRAIGRFVSEFSKLESMLQAFIAHEICLDGKFYHAIITYDFALSCTVLQSVVKISREQSVSDELSEIIKKCRALNDERVRVVHGYWEAHRDQLHHVSRNSLQLMEYDERADYLDRQADVASRLRVELKLLMARM